MIDMNIMYPFEAGYRERDPDCCWVWRRGKSGLMGYGKFRGLKAHRVAWERAHGPIPAGLFVCHRCDNPPCVNPAHLFLASHAENMADMVAKGRQFDQRGEGNPNAILSKEQVARLRRAASLGASVRELARRYGISKTQTHRIITRQRWA